jgi:hypothetical protein
MKAREAPVTAIRLRPRSNNFCLRNHNIFIGGQIIQRVARTGRISD